MADVDFEKLSNDELLYVLKAAMTEARERGGLICNQAEALKQAVVSAEKEKLEEEEKKKKAEKVLRLWRIKMAAIAAVRKWGYSEEFHIAIWSSDADRRVYFQKREGMKGYGWKFTLYLTGNQWHPPGKMTTEGQPCWFDDKTDLKAFLSAIADTWKGDIKIDSGDFQHDIVPEPKCLENISPCLGFLKRKRSACRRSHDLKASNPEWGSSVLARSFNV